MRKTPFALASVAALGSSPERLADPSSSPWHRNCPGLKRTPEGAP